MKNEITAQRLQIALKRKGISQQKLADLSGIKKESISQYVNGHHKPSNLSAGIIGNILGVNPMWLMGYEVDMLAPLDTGKNSITHEDAQLLKAYHSASEEARSIVRYTLKLPEELAKPIDRIG